MSIYERVMDAVSLLYSLSLASQHHSYISMTHYTTIRHIVPVTGVISLYIYRNK